VTIRLGFSRHHVRAIVLAMLVFILPGIQGAIAAEPLGGRNVTIVVGFGTGGAYDLYARALAHHIGRYLPGNPNIVVQNMPGGGGLKAAGYLYDVAPKDGSVIGTFARGNVIGPLFGEGNFDSTKFNWIGSVTDDVNTCLAWNTSAVATWDDLLSKPFIVAGQGPGADPDMYANIIRNVFHAPIKVVGGYPGSSDIALAMERGEVDGVCALSYSTVKTLFADKIKKKDIRIIFQAGLQKAATLTDVPLLLDKARDENERAALTLIMGVQGMARPFVAPPGLSPERIATLRDAFIKTMSDPEFLAETSKLNLEVNPTDGAKVNALVDKLYATPKEVVQQAKSFISDNVAQAK
jgi:tripartite-type tricarboxylate transporter receptor subunit TctC